MKTMQFTSAVLAIGSMLLALEPNQAKIDQVAKGELKEAHLSWWGFDAQDSTQIIRQALKSGASTLIVDKMESPWVTTPVFLHSGLTLIFDDGAEMLAKRGEFKGTNDSLINLNGVKDVTIKGRGKKGVLRMWKKDYQDPAQYQRAEWRHNIRILSSDNITIQNMTMLESGGDGIYLASANETPDHHCKDVVIRDCICDRQHRQGISVISAINLLIEDTRMTNTSGTPPAAGIDFEPNNGREPISCVMRNCVAEGNDGAGIEGYLAQFDSTYCGKLSIVLENCVMRHNKTSFRICTSDYMKRRRPMYGDIILKNCVLEEGQWNSAIMDFEMHHSLNYELRDCTLLNASRNKGVPMLIRYSPSGKTTTETRFLIENLKIIDDKDIRWLNIHDQACIGIDNYDIKGSFTKVIGGKSETVKLDKAFLKAYYPNRQYPNGAFCHEFDGQLKPKAKAGVPMPSFKIRHEGKFWLYAKAGENVSVTLNYAKLTRNSGVTQNATVIYPSGKTAVIGSVDFNTSKELTFKAEEGGILKLKLPNGNNTVSLGKCSVPAGVCQFDNVDLNLIYASGNLYFYVPANLKNSSIILNGDSNVEGINAEVYDPSGKLFYKGEDVCQAEEIVIDNSRPGVWRMKLSKPTTLNHEDLEVSFIRIPPYFAASPDSVPQLD